MSTTRNARRNSTHRKKPGNAGHDSKEDAINESA